MDTPAKTVPERTDTDAIPKLLDDGLLICIRSDHQIVFDGSEIHAGDGALFLVRSIEFVNARTLRAISTTGKELVCSNSSVSILNGRVPDASIDFWLVGHGYQADFNMNGITRCSACRDFGGTHEIPSLVHRLAKMFEGWLDQFRKDL